jgi:hypothetical protein
MPSATDSVTEEWLRVENATELPIAEQRQGRGGGAVPLDALVRRAESRGRCCHEREAIATPCPIVAAGSDVTGKQRFERGRS